VVSAKGVSFSAVSLAKKVSFSLRGFFAVKLQGNVRVNLQKAVLFFV
jgi:hypothetical protein